MAQNVKELRTTKTMATDTEGARITVQHRDGGFERHGYDFGADDPHVAAIEEHFHLGEQIGHGTDFVTKTEDFEYEGATLTRLHETPRGYAWKLVLA